MLEVRDRVRVLCSATHGVYFVKDSSAMWGNSTTQGFSAIWGGSTTDGTEAINIVINGENWRAEQVLEID